MDALTFLRADHEAVLAMLESLEGPPPHDRERLAARQETATALVRVESQHESIEEEVFWPAVRRALDDGDELADHAIEQETQAKLLLQTLEDHDAGSSDFEEALDRFIPAAREHIAYEEHTVWPALWARLDPEHRAALGEMLGAGHTTAPTRPHPHISPAAGIQGTVGVVAAALDKMRDKATGRGKAQPPEPPSV